MVMSNKQKPLSYLSTPEKRKEYIENFRWYEKHDDGVIQYEWQHESQFRIEEDENGS